MLVLRLHIHTLLEKLTFLDFFPSVHGKFGKMSQKRQKEVGEGGGGRGAIKAPCDQDTTLYGSKHCRELSIKPLLGGKNPKRK